MSASGSYGKRSSSSCAHINLSGSTCATSIVGMFDCSLVNTASWHQSPRRGTAACVDAAHDVGDLERSREHRVGALEELGSFARRPFELEQPVPLDRSGDAVGGQSQQLDVGGAEVAELGGCRRRGRPSSVSACSGTPAALRTLLPSTSPIDVDLREVVEHDGLASLRDPSGKAATDGHVQRVVSAVERGATALDELAARVVEQQHPHGVALEQRGDAPGISASSSSIGNRASARSLISCSRARRVASDCSIFEGLGPAQRLRAQVRDDLEVLPLGVGELAWLSEDEGERTDRSAVDEQRQRRDGLEPARHLEVFELGIPRV